MYPKLWRMIGKYTNGWKQKKWQLPSMLKNTTDFKNKVMEHVLTLRQSIVYESMPQLYKDSTSLTTTKCYFYDHSKFECHASRYYKVDTVAAKDKLLPQPNDYIRLFGIAALSDNRDQLLSIGAAKIYKRAEVDGTYLFYKPYSTFHTNSFTHSFLSYYVLYKRTKKKIR